MYSVDEKLSNQRAYDAHLEKAKSIEDLRVKSVINKELKKEARRDKIKEEKEKYQ